MVPMAPSSTRMRSRAAASSAVRWGETGAVIDQAAFCAPAGGSEQVADREHEIRAVHGVEMKGIDAVLGEFLHLAGRDRGGHQLAGLGSSSRPSNFSASQSGTWCRRGSRNAAR